MLDYTSFRAELKTGASGGYLFCGEESYLLRASLDSLKKSLFGEGGDDAFNHIKIDAMSDRGYDLAGSIAQLPVFADRRLVEVRGLDLSHMKAEAVDELREALSLLPDNPQTVVAVCATPYEFDASDMQRRPPKVFSKLSDLLTAVVFSRETPASLARWASSHFAHEGVKVDPAVVRSLIERTGCDMYSLSGEISKLSAWALASGTGTVTAEDVAAMCPVNAEFGAFDFSNAVLDGNFARAFYILSEQKKRKAEPVPLLADVMRCYARMETVSAFAEDGFSPSDTAKKLKMHEYAVRLHLKAAAGLGNEKIKRALSLCSDADFKMKFTAIDGYVVVYRLLARLAAL